MDGKTAVAENAIAASNVSITNLFMGFSFATARVIKACIRSSHYSAITADNPLNTAILIVKISTTNVVRHLNSDVKWCSMGEEN